MKVKTTITLSEELIKEIDHYSKAENNRSIFIETALWIYIDLLKRKIRDEKDAQIYKKNLKSINEFLNPSIDSVFVELPLFS